MLILGIETSCDETAAAVVKDGQKLLSSVIATSLDLHVPFGGVVPEIAARSHLEVIIPTIDEALKRAKTDWKNLDAIAVTQGPGLLGSLLIGVLTARTLAITKNKPLIPVNHVLAHVYAAFIDKPEPKFPLLALIVSGGHTSLVLFESYQKYKVLGQTQDDAVGEAYDKVAKMLGLPYPGGPSLAKLANSGDPKAFNFPKAKMPGYNFSFSGLKTAVLRVAQTQSGHDYTFPSIKLPAALNEAQKADIAASFQRTANETLAEALLKAEKEFKPKSIVVAGGVAANEELRRTISERLKIEVLYPAPELCTDNATMIAAAGFYNYKIIDSYSLSPNPSLTMQL